MKQEKKQEMKQEKKQQKEKKVYHPKLGNFVDERLKMAKITIDSMCKNIHMGKGTYSNLKKG